MQSVHSVGKITANGNPQRPCSLSGGSQPASSATGGLSASIVSILCQHPLSTYCPSLLQQTQEQLQWSPLPVLIKGYSFVPWVSPLNDPAKVVLAPDFHLASTFSPIPGKLHWSLWRCVITILPLEKCPQAHHAAQGSI